jgi:hypothetical protein
LTRSDGFGTWKKHTRKHGEDGCQARAAIYTFEVRILRNGHTGAFTTSMVIEKNGLGGRLFLTGKTARSNEEIWEKSCASYEQRVQVFFFFGIVPGQGIYGSNDSAFIIPPDSQLLSEADGDP